MPVATGLMLVGCGIMTTGVPTMITAGVTGTLPGASDYRATSGAWAQEHRSIGRVLLDDSGANAASGETLQTVESVLQCCTMLLLSNFNKSHCYLQPILVVYAQDHPDIVQMYIQYSKTNQCRLARL